MNERNYERDTMLDRERDKRDSDRIEKLEKKLSALTTLFIGYLVGHFLGIILFG